MYILSYFRFKLIFSMLLRKIFISHPWPRSVENSGALILFCLYIVCECLGFDLLLFTISKSRFEPDRNLKVASSWLKHATDHSQIYPQKCSVECVTDDDWLILKVSSRGWGSVGRRLLYHPVRGKNAPLISWP